MKEKIRLLLQDSMHFNADDLLVHLNENAIIPQIEGENYPFDELKSFLKKGLEMERESGVNPICLSKGLIRWTLKSTDDFIRTPIFLQSCSPKIDRVKGTVQFDFSDDELFINPFVLSHLKSRYGILFEGSESHFLDFLRDKGFNEIEEQAGFFGNFHPHRYEQIKELEALLTAEPSANLQELLEGDVGGNLKEFELTKEQLFSSDLDQNQVFDAIQVSNLVVQGPPGTGKSQVLSNLLAKLVFSSKSTVLVSEKRAALEVIKQKMGEFCLDEICYIADVNSSSKDLISDLKATWLEVEKRVATPVTNLLLSEQLVDRLQIRLDLLSDPQLFGGVSFAVYQNLLNKYSIDGIGYHSNVASLKESLDLELTLRECFQLKIEKEIACIKSVHFKSDAVKSLDVVVRDLLSELTTLEDTFNLVTYADLEKAMQLSALCQLYDTAVFKMHAHLFEEKEGNKFLKAYNAWLEVENEIELLNKQSVSWLKDPSSQDIELLLDQLQNNSFFGKRRFARIWKEYSIYSPEKALDLLKSRKNQLNVFEKHLKSQAKLLALNAPIERNQLTILAHQVRENDTEKMLRFKSIPGDLRTKMAASGGRLNQYYHKLRLYFSLDEDQNLKQFLEGILSKYAEILSVSTQLKEASPQIFRSLLCAHNYEQLIRLSLKATEMEFNLKFPQHANLKPQLLLSDSEEILRLRKVEAKAFAGRILHQQKMRFDEYHELLLTPSAKLNAEQREMKARLKKGKAILVKEFAKSRSFPSLRELFSSDARLWIQVLKPIWMCNPTQMARCFPMEQAIFDVAIFDEASQITIQNALGTIYRSQRILIAGDSQQMGPSSYFRAQKNDLVDVLHQASYYWKSIALRHHYRSEHPALIAFSNLHFYKNSLLPYPSPKNGDRPIKFHYCGSGIFESRRNVEEAKMVAKHLAKHLKFGAKLGLVAFSETQLDEVLKHLSLADRQLFEDRVENNSAFYKALENVQGDECDVLVISLGYGKDEEGHFHYRFGPLNGKNGSKRLNVLLTRARKQIDVFASVQSSDFEISKNESIELLRKYLYFIEVEHPEERNEFPYGLQVQIAGSELVIHHVQEQIKNAEELLTLVNILQHRLWKIQLN